MKRLTLGFFVSDVENGYSSLVTRNVVETAQRLGVHLVVFPGKPLKSTVHDHAQYNILYQLIRTNPVDALILASGVLLNFVTVEEYGEFCRQFSSIPIVSLSTFLERTSVVEVDNRVGLEAMIHHVVQVHGRKKLAFLSGPLANPEAFERYEVYRATLRKNALEVDENAIVFGDFTYLSVASAMKTLVETRNVVFDALICANDEMAIEAMEWLKRRNFRIPQDIVVTGFDNVDESRLTLPPLSTVGQPIDKMAVRAVELAVELARGGETSVVTLASRPLFRESCGCASTFRHDTQWATADPFADATEEQKALVEEIRNVWIDPVTSLTSAEFIASLRKRWLDRPFYDSQVHLWQTAIVQLKKEIECSSPNVPWPEVDRFFDELWSLLIVILQRHDAQRWSTHQLDIRTLRAVLTLMVEKVESVSAALEELIPDLAAVGIESGYLYLYETPYVHEFGQPWKVPQALKIAMAYREGRSILSELETQSLTSSELFRFPLDDGLRRTLVINPLFVGSEHFGFFLCEMNFDDRFLFESLCVQLSCSLKLMKHVHQHRVMEKNLYSALTGLEESNRKLDNLSQTDELTGLYNRRGFLNLARQNMDLVKRMKKQGNLFFGDLDGLKIINDTWGHEEGDRAIKAIAEILRHVFRNMDIVARLGGDEFTVFAADTDVRFIEILNGRVQDHIDEFNRKGEHPFDLSMSLGAVPFDHTTEKSIEELMAEADAQLYRNKRLRTKEN